MRKMTLLKALLRALIKSRMAAAKREIDRLHLHRMTDKELADIGINRCDINRLV
jgi:uncharacterized protein YjiS (DUF1127 family)